MRSFLAIGGLLVVSWVLAGGERTPPKGWKESSAKDKSFSVWLPERPGRTSDREQTSTVQGNRLKFEVLQLAVNNGPTYSAASVQFPLQLIRQLQPKERIELFRDIFVSELKGRVEGEAEIKLGKVPGREYLIDAGAQQARLVLFASGSRVYQAMIVGAKGQVESADANLFLDSFKITTPTTTDPSIAKSTDKTTPKTPAKTTPKSTDPAPAVTGDKAVWTTNLAAMKFPDGPASGKIMGMDFTVESAKVDTVGVLTIRQGKGFHPDAAILIFLGEAGRAGLEGKTFEVGVDTPVTTRPHIHLKRMEEGKKVPGGKAFITGYAMKLEFGQAQGGVIPGKIYVCLSDPGRTIVAGTFQLSGR